MTTIATPLGAISWEGELTEATMLTMPDGSVNRFYSLISMTNGACLEWFPRRDEPKAEFVVEVTYATTKALRVVAANPDAAISAALALIRLEDPYADPQIASVLDPDDTTGNGMPLVEWFAE